MITLLLELDKHGAYDMIKTLSKHACLRYDTVRDYLIILERMELISIMRDRGNPKNKTIQLTDLGKDLVKCVCTALVYESKAKENERRNSLLNEYEVADE